MAIVSDTDAREFIGLASDDKLLPLLRKGVERALERFLGYEVERAQYTRYFPKGELGGKEYWWPGEFGGVDDVGGITNIIQLDHKFVLIDGTLAVSVADGAYAGQYASTSWTALTKGTQFAMDTDDGNVSETGHLKRLGTYWPKMRGSVKVVYNAGFSLAELSGDTSGSTDHTDASDVRLAVLLSLEAAWQNANAWKKTTDGSVGPVISERIDDWGATYDTNAIRRIAGMANLLPPIALDMLAPYQKLGFGP